MTLSFHYLLIDDSLHDQLLAQEAFDQLCPDCQLTCAASGEEALELLRTRACQPDVILLDINMPGMNGFEVLEAMKDDARLSTIPIVMLSTSNAQDDVRKAYTLHASSYLAKSASFEGFLEQIETFLKYWQTSRLSSG